VEKTIHPRVESKAQSSNGRGAARLSRRELLQRGSAVGLGAAGASVFLNYRPQTAAAAVETLGTPRRAATLVRGQTDKYKGTTLTFAAQFHPSVEGVKPLLGKFEEETGIKVQVDEYPYPDILNKQEVAYASGSSAFDIGMADPLYVLTWFNAGWVEPLQSYVDNTDLTDTSRLKLSDFLAKPIAQLTDPKTKQLTSLPIYAESIELMYRKDLFDKYGAKVPETFDELMDAAGKLHHPDDGITGISLRGQRGAGLNVYIWTSVLKAYGGRFFDETYQPVLNTPEAITAAEYYAELLNKYGLTGPANIGWEETLTNMQQGKLGMIIDATVFAGPLESPKDSTVQGKVGYAFVPSGPKGRVPSLAAWGLFIPKAAKNKEAAWQFIQWATSSEIELQSAKLGPRSDVTRTSTWGSEEFRALKQDWGDWSDVTQASLEESDPDYRPRISNWPAVGDRLGVALSEIIAGQTPAEEALGAANEEIAKMMKDAGYA
jgi:multiple sugar transport system substrate-binding protein